MVNVVALAVFVILFVLVTVLGFLAANWRRGNLDLLHEWGLAGRRFGTIVTWFLLGGDLYTAYTFIAVPALVYGSGAIGFFAVPYTVIVYPIVFVIMPRLWSVSHKHGYITGSDFVRGRYGSPTLALAVAVTGILATMPYIALQLVGIEVVLAGLGITGDLPLIIAFLILASYTYFSGLRAPAMIALVKDVLIYTTIIVAIIAIPAALGGFGNIFAAVAAATPPRALVIPANQFVLYSTLAFGSALALFMYPHAITGVLSANSREVIRRNAAFLPAYSLVLGLLALFGFMALAAGVKTVAPYGAQWAVPGLFTAPAVNFPSWFIGFAFAAIAIGALVPASVMSIAAANLFTRNIYREYIRPNLTDQEEASTAKLASLVVKVGALAFIIFLPIPYAINFQLLGGVWIIETFPAIVFGLYNRWFHPWALLLGWLVGMVTGTAMAASVGFSSAYPLHLGATTIIGYSAFYALVLNLVVAVVATIVLRALAVAPGKDETSTVDYVGALRTSTST
jgi:SSS family solute:Na+ symporter